MYTLSHGFSLFNSKENITFTQRTPSGRIKMALFCVSTIQWSEQEMQSVRYVVQNYVCLYNHLASLLCD